MRQRLDDLRQRHADDVLDLVAKTIRRVTPEDSPLIEMCDYHMQTGGKRLRAIMPLAVAEALGTPPERALPFGAACELLHNATLVHDDLQDGDTTRRDETTVWKHFGEERAINAGDAMLYWPISLLDRLECSDRIHRRLVQRLVRDMVRVIDGQEREFLLMTRQNVSLEGYSRMVEGKTGGLFSLAAAGAAELAEASEACIEAIERAATQLGVLFQIQDDVLDLYGDKGREQPGNDLREGKISALVVHFAERVSEERVERLLDLLSAPREAVTPEDIESVAEAFRSTGALDAALDDIESRRASIFDDPELNARPELAELFEGLADLFVAPIDHLLTSR